MKIKLLHQELIYWYQNQKRDLPWRKSKNPYHIWISEIMLQQTRVETVIPYYHRFLSNFPTIQALAEADEDRLLNLWAGLGYYSRARNLKKAAQVIIEKFAGHLPHHPELLQELPGIGPYTAAAIASIAHGESIAAIDGNLERVFSRLLALKLNPKTKGRTEILSLGENLALLGKAGDMNQAFMDLASSICLPKIPRCEECPIGKHCEARRQDIQQQIPIKKKKEKPIELNAEAWVLLVEDSILLARRPSGAWLAGLWDLPWWIKGKKSSKRMGREFAVSTQTRTITKHKIFFEVHGLLLDRRPNESSLKRALPAPQEEFRWVKLEDLHGVNLPRPSEKALSEILAQSRA